MLSRSRRFVSCAVVGLLASRVLGPLFVPDPTSPTAVALTVVLAAAIGGGLYRTGWLSESNGTG